MALFQFVMFFDQKEKSFEIELN